ncbi:MAG: hypothetical protein ACTSWP_11555 [Candidatus Freyarchaeota archaeon]|nr:hypothetical protein [Candidatus Freyrarchaeum guaymaensis]
MARIDASKLSFRELNQRIRALAMDGASEIEVVNVNGQRYIGAGLRGNLTIKIYGTPGNDLAVFMDGPTILVYGNGQDGVCNTMNNGLVVVHGDVRDIPGYSMRGGTLLVKGNAGYRVGIHMKAYGESVPKIVIGGVGSDFLGEYMAGGVIVVLNLNDEESPVGFYTGTGMHGGAIYIRGKVRESDLGVGARIAPIKKSEIGMINELVKLYSASFNTPLEISPTEFMKVTFKTRRPFGSLYVLE